MELALLASWILVACFATLYFRTNALLVASWEREKRLVEMCEEFRDIARDALRRAS